MKRILLVFTSILLITITFNSCSSMMASMELTNAKNRANEHAYIEALNMAVSSLVYSENESTDAADLIVEIVASGDAYYNDLIQQYKASEEGNALAEIYNNYENLVNLYAVVVEKGLQNFTAGGKNYSVKAIDYLGELNAARDEAATVYYDAAVANMNTATLAGYRQAYYNLDFVKSMYTGIESPFSDLNTRLQEAYDEGTIDIFVVVPSDLDLESVSESMGDLFKSYVSSQSEWVKFHQGNDIDMSYQLWEAAEAGEKFIDTVSGKINNSNGVLSFGREIGADIVIYAAYDNLRSNDITTTEYTDSFSGISSEDEEYLLELSWYKLSKKTSVNYSYFVVDIKTGETLAQSVNKKSIQDITLYGGTYTISPNIWFASNTKNFAELLDIAIPEYWYVKAGYNGWAYRVSYDNPDMEAIDKEHFDEQLTSYKANAEAEALYNIAKQTAQEAAAAIADLF